MKKVKANESDLISAANYSQSINEDLSSSLKESKTLLKSVADMNWKGSARDAFISYLDIISQYHTDIKDAAKKQHKAFDKLNSKIGSYPSDKSVTEVKKI